MGENSILSILILLLLFVGLPSLLKRMGQYTGARRDGAGHHEQEQGDLHEEHMPDYPDELLSRHDVERTTRESFTNKPIHPKWF